MQKSRTKKKSEKKEKKKNQKKKERVEFFFKIVDFLERVG
jgi:hypothetical protein